MSRLESQNHHMEVEMQNINNKQNPGSFEADAKTSAAEADRLKEALEDMKADSAQQQEEMTRRLKESEKEKDILQRSLDTEKKATPCCGFS